MKAITTLIIAATALQCITVAPAQAGMASWLQNTTSLGGAALLAGIGHTLKRSIADKDMHAITGTSLVLGWAASMGMITTLATWDKTDNHTMGTHKAKFLAQSLYYASLWTGIMAGGMLTAAYLTK